VVEGFGCYLFVNGNHILGLKIPTVCKRCQRFGWIPNKFQNDVIGRAGVVIWWLIYWQTDSYPYTSFRATTRNLVVEGLGRYLFVNGNHILGLKIHGL